ncbi:MAG: hypothetical protein QF632_04615, partial [Candidatus Woesearchaeota archaeon]|nr:hypothetical protein [Candidatus Woesearchaeota archaeon]
MIDLTDEELQMLSSSFNTKCLDEDSYRCYAPLWEKILDQSEADPSVVERVRELLPNGPIMEINELVIIKLYDCIDAACYVLGRNNEKYEHTPENDFRLEHKIVQPGTSNWLYHDIGEDFDRTTQEGLSPKSAVLVVERHDDSVKTWHIATFLGRCEDELIV